MPGVLLMNANNPFGGSVVVFLSLCPHSRLFLGEVIHAQIASKGVHPYLSFRPSIRLSTLYRIIYPTHTRPAPSVDILVRLGDQ